MSSGESSGTFKAGLTYFRYRSPPLYASLLVPLRDREVQVWSRHWLLGWRWRTIGTIGCLASLYDLEPDRVRANRVALAYLASERAKRIPPECRPRTEPHNVFAIKG